MIGTYVLSAEVRGMRITDTKDKIKMSFQARNESGEYQCVFWNTTKQGKKQSVTPKFSE